MYSNAEAKLLQELTAKCFAAAAPLGWRETSNRRNQIDATSDTKFTLHIVEHAGAAVDVRTHGVILQKLR